MITCTRCGADNDASDTSCHHCGVQLDDAAARQLVGTVVLGVYEIVDVLGQGGMSVVYKARHRMTDQQVALKILPPELAVHRALKTRFLEEAKALAKLEHPNIVHLYNFGEEGGRFVLAMQYVEGETFEKKIFTQGRLPWREAVEITIQVLRALEYAHARGVVHRDIKPSNVLVRKDGVATVMDFGIAKMTESTRLTATGQTMGTVRYMSPEQVRGAAVDHRSDLYSVGVTLYEALAGDTPFGGDTHFEIMSKHLSERPAALRPLLLAHNVDLPEALDRVVLKSLEKACEQRFADAREFREALEAVLRGAPIDAGATAGRPAGPVELYEAGARTAPAALTGLASALEPALDAPIRRSRAPLWIGLAAVVVAAGVAVLVVTGGRRSSAQAGVEEPSEPGPPPLPAWPEPLRLPEHPPVADKRFEAQKVRVLSAREGVDPAEVARAYAAARQRFATFMRGHNPGLELETTPVNVYVVPARALCDPRISEPRPPAADCEKKGHEYHLDSRTVFVAAEELASSTALVKGAAFHICITTRAIVKDCFPLLAAYYDEVDR